jgi:hypothetical protein
MLDKIGTLEGYGLDSLDGDIGSVKEFYFDDRHWTIRYLVAETGNWLKERQVLISPYALTFVDREAEKISVDLSRKQIEESPSLDTDKPVSRHYEETFYQYYGWQTYWDGPFAWGNYPYLARTVKSEKNSIVPEKAWDSHLRSTRDVTGHSILATDGEIGHVEDFILDDDNWMIRYLVVDTRNWWPGKKVLISPRWIDTISWSESSVRLNLTRAAIECSPEYTEASLVTRAYEDQLHGHYNREGYWVGELAARENSR